MAGLGGRGLTTIIVDYEAGNLRSVARACAEVGLEARISGDPECVAAAERVIFPGVGAAGSAMQSLKRSGLDVALLAAYGAGTPILGICLGLQISLQHSEEGDTPTLGLIAGEVRRFEFPDPNLKVPHMGWNEVRPTRPHSLLASIEPGDEFYFVHSYFPRPSDGSLIYAEATYEHNFCCALGVGNYFGVQFHPEKSGRVGLRLLAEFAKWRGKPC